jgi:glucokinase
MAESGASRPLRLVGDVGGTHARFALVEPSGALREQRVLASADFRDLAEAVDRYLSAAGVRGIDEAAVAVACPVVGDEVRLTNLDWTFSIAATRERLGLSRLKVLNDFEALALSLPALGAADLEVVLEGERVRGAPCALIGPGTGLGVAGLVPAGDGWVAVPGEGGHRDLAPASPREWRIFERLAERFGHVSAERVLSGPGLVWLYEAICAADGRAAERLEPPEVSARAAAGDRAASGEAAALFSGWLGAVAGDLALTLGARGGVFLGGGLLERMGAAFDRARFAARFLAKGRFESYLRPIPVALVRHPFPALLGAARALEASRGGGGTAVA